LTAAGAAVGGFFGFPMAGALFVLEIPHRMGLQYFEALSPATISSIVAVLCNGFVSGSDVTGYYKYPFLNPTLPGKIFSHAILYGVYGALVGTIYVVLVKRCKELVHGLFQSREGGEQVHQHGEDQKQSNSGWDGEVEPLVNQKKPFITNSTSSARPWWTRCASFCTIKHEGLRAIVTGAMAGAMVGWIGVFYPHVMFWGEAQLQSLIDRGRTPLPIFGSQNEPTDGLTAKGFCMVDSSHVEANQGGLGLGCSFMISFAKIFVTGLSLGAGIGGQFWGPLFVGCSAGHFLVDFVNWLAERYGFPGDLAAFPCVVILCSMGAAHVVTFRAHLSIMLILTLTISTFDSDKNPDLATAGDYSAVFPLLVVSVFVSLMTTRGTVFYATQRSRGDITAVPEVLCEPSMEGKPLGFEYHGDSDESSLLSTSDDVSSCKTERPSCEARFYAANEQTALGHVLRTTPSEDSYPIPLTDPFSAETKTTDSSHPMDRLDELLAAPVRSFAIIADPSSLSYHETVGLSQSPSRQLLGAGQITFESPRHGRPRSNSASSARGAHVRISSYGELLEHQPSLLEQARMRAATIDRSEAHRRVGSQTSITRGEGHHPHPSNLNQDPTIEHIRKNLDGSHLGAPLMFHRRQRTNSYDAAYVPTPPGSGPVATSTLYVKSPEDALYSHIR
jgi:H+/Cl- antiporter ClcA